MAKYIDADALMRKIEEELQPGVDYFRYCFTDIVREMPAADVDPVRKWISVDERLPEAGKECLVYVNYNKFIGMYEIEHLEANGEWWGDCLGGKVLYWIPIPEPPKMDGGSE